ncbi:MAG: DUF1552 domain-containing protein, partial [Vicinamibacterales bacterium]
MVITKRALSRRTVVRALGASVALPFLDAMVPALSSAATVESASAKRFAAVYVPNGIAMEYWTPEAEGRDFALPSILEPFKPFRDQLLVVSGLKAYWDVAHAGASTTFLTGAAGVRGENAPVAGISIDQIMANEFGQKTELTSLELAIEGRANAGQCANGHSCVYTNTFSWRNRTTPLPMENNPRAVFERMFGDTCSTDPAVRRARLQRDRSILDSVRQKVAELSGAVGAGDRLKIDEYMEGVRDVERRIQRTEQNKYEGSLPLFEQPEGIPDSFEEHVKLMFDLQLLAFQSDLTRVSTFMFGREVSSRIYPEVGVQDAHHALSHHRYDKEKIAEMSKINRYHATLFAWYLEKLRNTMDGERSLLDSMVALYGCGMSDSNAHSPLNVPIVAVGGALGKLTGGRHLKYAGDPPL